MKTQLLTLILILFSTILFCQEKGNITGKFYIADVDIVVEEYNITKEKTIVNPKKYIAQRNTKFTAHEIIDKKLLVKFWKYKDNTENSASNQTQPVTPEEEYKYISINTNDKYFLIDLEEFNKKTSEYNGSNHSVIWGFSTLPIKLRFSGENRPFLYETGFSLGINAGYEYQFRSRTKQSIGFLLGIGVSTIAITPESVNNYVDESSTAGAFTPSLGIVYSFESFQIGLFTGYDIIPGPLGENWVYRNSPWLGLGLGFTIFQKNKTTNASTQEQ